MEIILDNHTNDKVYSTLDAISGKVQITASRDARFDEIQITLEGSIKTYVENMSPHSTRSKITAYHNFLKLTMPIADSDYPQPRIAEAGQKYTFPFNFVIPEQLLPRACSHKCVAEHVHHAHIQLPPSMGDREVSPLDDLAPEMARVHYSIKVRVIRAREMDMKEVICSQGQRKIRVIPAAPEMPPLSIRPGEVDYILAKTKTLKKGVFSGKLGKITVSALQPGALTLLAPSNETIAPPTTMASLQLRFDPRSESSEPPRLGGLTTKLRVSTFFAARPAQTFPTRVSLINNFDVTRSVYETSLSLSSRCVSSATWTKHRPAPAYTRRCSSSSTSSSSSDDSAIPKMDLENEKCFYTSTILVPITLPVNKTFIPTFHSCVVSRVYTVDLSLSIHTPGTGVPASTVTLHVPIQIAAEGNVASPRVLGEEGVAVDGFLQPRVFEVREGGAGINEAILDEGMVMDLPPEYERVERVRSRDSQRRRMAVA